MTGPRAKEPGYDYILQGLAGWMSLTGEPDGPPTKSGLSLVDYAGGFVGALALLAAVHSARRDGVGSDCDISLYDVAVTMLTYPATWYLNRDWIPTRTSRSAHPSLVPFQLFQDPTAHGFSSDAPKRSSGTAWQKSSVALTLASDPRFDTFSNRAEHRDELIDLLDDAFAAEPAEHWITKLREAAVPTGPVQDVPAALADPHTEARGLITSATHPRLGPVRQLISPVRVGDTTSYSYRRAPQRNEDADYVLRNLLGYDASTVDELEREGAFGGAEVAGDGGREHS